MLSMSIILVDPEGLFQFHLLTQPVLTTCTPHVAALGSYGPALVFTYLNSNTAHHQRDRCSRKLSV